MTRHFPGNKKGSPVNIFGDGAEIKFFQHFYPIHSRFYRFIILPVKIFLGNNRFFVRYKVFFILI